MASAARASTLPEKRVGVMAVLIEAWAFIVNLASFVMMQI
jgi:hypothetical protein